MNHTHDGTVRPHHFMIKHDKATFDSDKDADLRDPKMAHNTASGYLETEDKANNTKAKSNSPPILELGKVGGIDFQTWSSHSFGLASPETRAYITLILRKVEHQHKVGNFEDSLRREQESLAEVNQLLAQMEIPL